MSSNGCGMSLELQRTFRHMPLPSGRSLYLALAVAALALPAQAQVTTPDEAPLQFQSVALAPNLELTNIGWDSNVLQLPDSADPQSDVTATFSPSLSAWVRRSRFLFTGHGDIDFNYFHDLASIRSVDQDYDGEVQAPLGRLVPFAQARWARARHRQTLEIDRPVRRYDSDWTAGVDVELGGRASVGVLTTHLRVRYDEAEASDLALTLNTDSRADGARLRYALTPLTTLGVEADRDELRFELDPTRNSSGYRVRGLAEFKPTALISGRASVGIRHREFDTADEPPYTGTIAALDLSYRLLGRTRFDVELQRDLSSSYRADYLDFLQTGLGLAVTHRLSGFWDVLASAARYDLDYGISNPSASDAAPAERVVNYSAGIAYRLGRGRLGVDVSHQDRTAASDQSRYYRRTRVSSFFTYGF